MIRALADQEKNIRSVTAHSHNIWNQNEDFIIIISMIRKRA
jgi:hypothetical protein